MSVLLYLGTAQLASDYGAANTTGPPSRVQALEILRSLRPLGFSGVDTAPSYGEAETLIGLSGIAGEVDVTTKFDRGVPPAASLERSLARLQASRIDTALFHDSSVVTTDPDDAIAAAASLRGEALGKIGVSVYTVTEFRAAVANPLVDVVQVPLNPAGRAMSAAVREARASGKEIIARSVFLQGALLLTTQTVPDHLNGIGAWIDELVYLSNMTARAIPELVIAWVRDHPGVSGIVVGAETRQQVVELGRWFGSEPLPAIVYRRLDALPQLDEQLLDPRMWPLFGGAT